VTTKGSRQFVKYTFYKLDPAWRRLPPERRAEDKKEFAAVVTEIASDMTTRSYSTVGMRGDTDLLLWQATDTLEQVQDSATRVLSTSLGAYLDTSHSFLALTRVSHYVDDHRHEGQEGRSLEVKPSDARYFFVYPFLKTREWYLLEPEERQAMMSEHFKIGHKYPSVKINTSYSFGIDDQEFMVAFESDSPSDFLELVEELRGVRGSLFTLRDTPIITCIRKSIEDTLETLGG
jgi:chlorite dismutase